MSKSTPSCCTCAQPLSNPSPPLSSYDLCEKPLPQRSPSPTSPPRHLPCCSRSICSPCLRSNPRFESYCPFCQLTTGPSSLPQGLRDPPAYEESPAAPAPPRRHLDDAPPTYDSLQRADERAPDVTHHLHATDTIPALSLAYHVPAAVLRQHNRLTSDHLLSARRTLSIPASHYKGGVSLSPRPVESEEEREKKLKLRRFMTGTKCAEYDVAEVYLREAGGELERALERWREDEKWERENPMGKGKGKGKAGGGRGGVGLVGQLGLR